MAVLRSPYANLNLFFHAVNLHATAAGEWLSSVSLRPLFQLLGNLTSQDGNATEDID